MKDCLHCTDRPHSGAAYGDTECALCVPWEPGDVAREVPEDNHDRLIAAGVLEPLLTALVEMTLRQQRILLHRINSADPSRKRMRMRFCISRATLERDIAQIGELLPHTIPLFYDAT